MCSYAYYSGKLKGMDVMEEIKNEYISILNEEIETLKTYISDNVHKMD